MKYFIQHFPVWHCGGCGRAYSSLENMCFFCHKEQKEARIMPPRHQYRDVPTMPVGREYFEGSVDLDYYKR